MGVFSKYFVDVKNGTKITYSESDLRKLDRTYEKEVFQENRKKILSPLRKVPQQAYLTQLRDYAFERVLDSHMYTFQHILVVPNPYDLVKQSALLLFNSSKERKVRYRVLGKTPEADFTGETEYTTRHRVPIMGLYLKCSNKVILELVDTEGVVVKRRLLRIYVSETPRKIKDVIGFMEHKEMTHFPFVLVNGVAFNPFVVDCNGDIRYSIQLRTNSIGMLPLEGGHFLYEDRTANRMDKKGRIQPCRYHEMDYMGRVYRTFLLESAIVGKAAQKGRSLFLATAADDAHVADKMIELDMNSGKIIKECDLVSLLGDKYRNRRDWAAISHISYHENYLILVVKRLHTIIKLDWENLTICWVLAPENLWKGTALESYLLRGNLPAEQLCRRPDSVSVVEYDTEKQTERLLLFQQQSMGDVSLETRDNADSAIVFLEIQNKTRTFETVCMHDCVKTRCFGSAIYSADRERILLCAGRMEKEEKGAKAQLLEMDSSTGEIYRKIYFKKAFNKVWLFEPQIGQLGHAVENTDAVIFGSLMPPAPFTGQMPREVEEPIDREYFSGVRLCDELFLSNILPGRVDRIYFIGSEHAYVQDYSNMVAGRVKFSFAISLTEFARDEYYVYVESQNVVHRLKNEIRIDME